MQIEFSNIITGMITQWPYWIQLLAIISLVAIGVMSYFSDHNYTRKAFRNIAIFILFFTFCNIIYGVRIETIDHSVNTFLLLLSLSSLCIGKSKLSATYKKYTLIGFLAVLAVIVLYFDLFKNISFEKRISINQPFRLYFSGYTQWGVFILIFSFVSFLVSKKSQLSKIATIIRIMSVLLIAFWTTLFSVKILDRKNVIYYGSLNKVTANVHYGIGPNATNKYGETKLHKAIKEGNLRAVKTLVKQGANLNQEGGNFYAGKTPLMLAMQKNHFDIFLFLIENGADVNKVDEQGYFPMLSATRGIPYIEALIKNGADISMRKANNKVQLIHNVARGGFHSTKLEPIHNIDQIEFLVRMGADINSQSKLGTALHFAAMNSNIEGLIKLLELGADSSIVNSMNQTPLDVALGAKVGLTRLATQSPEVSHFQKKLKRSQAVIDQLNQWNNRPKEVVKDGLNQSDLDNMEKQ